MDGHDIIIYLHSRPLYRNGIGFDILQQHRAAAIRRRR